MKDFVLKQKSVCEDYNAKFFIVDAINQSSCTREAFIYMDPASNEKTLQMCYVGMKIKKVNNK